MGFSIENALSNKDELSIKDGLTIKDELYRLRKKNPLRAAPLDWQYAELPSSASDAVLCSVLVRKMWVI